jgi:hypothetical protein
MDYRQLGDDLWARFNGGKDGTLWYYQSLVAIYSAVYPGPLTDDFAATVAGFSN